MLAPAVEVDERMIAAAGKTSLDADIASLRRVAAAEPRRPQIWRLLADHLDIAGDRAGAAQAYLAHVRHAIHDPALMAAGAALQVRDADQLFSTAARLLDDGVERERMRTAALEFIAAHRGATDRLWRWLEPRLR